MALETLHPGGLKAFSYQGGGWIRLSQGPCSLEIEADVLRVIVESHDPREA